MKRIALSLLFFLMSVLTLTAEPVKTKVIDDGGSGMFKAIAVKEKGLPDLSSEGLYVHSCPSGSSSHFAVWEWRML